MRKRLLGFSLSALLLVITFAVEARQLSKTPTVGLLRPGSPPDPYVEAFREGLRELGYVEGQSVAFEYRWAMSRSERLLLSLPSWSASTLMLSSRKAKS